VTLTWSAPASNGGTAVTDYTVQSSSDGGKTWKAFADAVSTATSAVVTGLANGTSYVFRVAAVNAVGTGAFSGNSVAVIPATVPNAPSGLEAKRGVLAVILTWRAPSSNGGAPVTDYVIEWSSDDGKTWKVFADAVSTETSAIVSGLSNSVTYRFRVAAKNAVGTGASASVTLARVS
jgi:titin